MPITTRSRGIRGAVLVLAGGLVFAACGDDADDPGDASPTTDAPASVDTPAEPEGETISVTAVDYGFEGLPATASVGDKLVLSTTRSASSTSWWPSDFPTARRGRRPSSWRSPGGTGGAFLRSPGGRLVGPARRGAPDRRRG